MLLTMDDMNELTSIFMTKNQIEDEVSIIKPRLYLRDTLTPYIESKTKTKKAKKLSIKSLNKKCLLLSSVLLFVSCSRHGFVFNSFIL